VPDSWARRVFPTKGEVNSQAYTLCVVERLHQALRRREVFVPTSERYADSRAELLRGVAWEVARDSVARALDRSLDPAVELTRLQQQLRAAYTELSENLAHNTALQLVPHEGLPVVMLTPLPAQAEPTSLARLRAHLTNLLPPVELAALLLEVEAFTGFAKAFTHVADGQPAAADLPLSICAVLVDYLFQTAVVARVNDSVAYVCAVPMLGRQPRPNTLYPYYHSGLHHQRIPFVADAPDTTRHALLRLSFRVLRHSAD
jgi:hypothetical protein